RRGLQARLLAGRLRLALPAQHGQGLLRTAARLWTRRGDAASALSRALQRDGPNRVARHDSGAGADHSGRQPQTRAVEDGNRWRADAVRSRTYAGQGYPADARVDGAFGNRAGRVDSAWAVADSGGCDARAGADLGAVLCVARAAGKVSRKFPRATSDRVSRLHGADGANDDALQDAGESPDRTREGRRRAPAPVRQLAKAYGSAGLLERRKHHARPPDRQDAETVRAQRAWRSGRRGLERLRPRSAAESVDPDRAQDRRRRARGRQGHQSRAGTSEAHSNHHDSSGSGRGERGGGGYRGNP